MSHRGFPITQSVRQFRRTEAEKRQEAYDKLTLQQKLAALPPEPQAARQRARLLAQLNKPAPVAKVTEVTAPVVTVSADEKVAIKAEIKAKKFNKRSE